MSGKRLLALLVLFLFIALRLWRLTDYGLFGDEPFGVYLANQSWRELFAIVIRDVVHPPLFYILLKFWVGVFGDSIFAVKLFAVFFAIASIAPLMMLVRELRLSRDAINLFFWIVGVNAYLIFYSQELRMYSLVMFTSSCSLWLFVKLLRANQDLWKIQVALFAANLILIYSHYYGWMFVAVQFIVLLIRQRNKLNGFVAMSTFLVACFLPWAYLVAQAAKMKGGLAANLSWNPRPGVKDLLWYFINLNGAMSYRWESYGFAYKILLGIYVFITLFLIHALVRYAKKVWSTAFRRNIVMPIFPPEGGTPNLHQSGTLHLLRGNASNSSLQALFLFAFVPPVMAFFASYLLSQSVWGMRFLVLSAAPYLLVLTLAILHLEPQRLRRFAIVVLILWTALSGYTELTNREKLNVESLVREMRQVEDNQTQPIRIYTDNGLVGNTMQFYLERFHERRFEIVYVDGFDAIEDEHYWVAFLKYRFDNHPLVQDDLAAKGLQIQHLFQTASPGHKIILFSVQP